jgi:DNA-binding NtrC family response regulator
MKAVQHHLKDNHLISQPVEIAGRWPAGDQQAAYVIAVEQTEILEISRTFDGLLWVAAGKHPQRSLSQVLLPRARKAKDMVGTRANYDAERTARRSIAALLRNAISSRVSAGFVIAVPAPIFQGLWRDAQQDTPPAQVEEVPAELPCAKSISTERHPPLAQIQVPKELEMIILGCAPNLHRVRQMIMLAVRNPQTTVLIMGELGTGKDLVARTIHSYTSAVAQLAHGGRNAANFINVDMNLGPDTLFESELFGCKKGAFSGAVYDRPGQCHKAQGGTLLINEVGDTPAHMQGKLLRLFECKRFLPVGAAEEEQLEARLIAATNKNLDQMVQMRRFRGDLYDRIRNGGITILTPVLRDHKEDIPPIARELWRRRTGNPEAWLPEEAVRELQLHNWPGNVRELDSLLSRLLLQCGDRDLGAEHVRRCLYLTGARTTLSPAEPSVESFETFKLDCLRHLIRVGVVIRSCKITLREIIIENKLDAQTCLKVHSLLKDGPFMDLDVQTRNPLAFLCDFAFTAVIELKKKLRYLIKVLDSDQNTLQGYDVEDLKHAFDTALKALFQAERQIMGNGPIQMPPVPQVPVEFHTLPNQRATGQTQAYSRPFDNRSQDEVEQGLSDDACANEFSSADLCDSTRRHARSASGTE